MTGFSEAWKRAGEPPDEYDPANGSHQVLIVEASAFHGRDTRQWAKCVLQIDAGPDVGRRFDHFMNLNNDVGLRIARESLITYGLDATALDREDADIETLHTAMQPLVGTVAQITVSHSDGFRNVRVDSSRTRTSPDTPAAPAADGFEQAAGLADEPAPF